DPVTLRRAEQLVLRLCILRLGLLGIWCERQTLDEVVVGALRPAWTQDIDRAHRRENDASANEESTGCRRWDLLTSIANRRTAAVGNDHPTEDAQPNPDRQDQAPAESACTLLGVRGFLQYDPHALTLVRRNTENDRRGGLLIAEELCVRPRTE